MTDSERVTAPLSPRTRSAEPLLLLHGRTSYSNRLP